MCPRDPTPQLRILDPRETEERICARQPWVELWQAIAREADRDEPRKPRDDEETAA